MANPLDCCRVFRVEGGQFHDAIISRAQLADTLEDMARILRDPAREGDVYQCHARIGLVSHSVEVDMRCESARRRASGNPNYPENKRAHARAMDIAAVGH